MARKKSKHYHPMFDALGGKEEDLPPGFFDLVDAAYDEMWKEPDRMMPILLSVEDLWSILIKLASYRVMVRDDPQASAEAFAVVARLARYMKQLGPANARLVETVFRDN